MLSAREPDPPVLDVIIPTTSELSNALKSWNDVELPIDILLLTVKDPEFLACYRYLLNPYRSYSRGLGYVYFGLMGEGHGIKLKIALIKCSEGAIQPGGAMIKVRTTVEALRPKAVFCVGYCGALHGRDKIKLGDVVVSAKLTTYAERTYTNYGVQPRGFSTPVGRDIDNLIRHAADGWIAPLQSRELAKEINVHCDGEFLSGPEEIDSDWRRQELVRIYPHAIAVEQDGQGIFAAAHDLRMEWVVIKSIADYADGTASSTEHWRLFASVMAASVVKNILREPVVFEQWPHYQNNDVRAAQNQGQPRTQAVSSFPPLPMNQGPPPGENRSTRPNNADGFLGSILQTMQTYIGDFEKGQLTYRGREIHYSSHKRMHSWDELEVFDGRAWDLESGISTESRHYNSSREAIEHAVQKLKDRLDSQGIPMD